tara:strand:+ start:10460 stop:10915 length:456 start_codon:yes stop_codon:yes gene_type:complete
MALKTTLQTLVNTERKLVIKKTGIFDDSTQEDGVTLIDASSFTSIGGRTCSYVSIDRVWTHSPRLIIDLLWASDNNYPAFSLGGASTAASDFNYDFSAWGGLKPPTFGSAITSSETAAGSGTPTGDLLMDTRFASSTDQYVIVIEGTKHYA